MTTLPRSLNNPVTGEQMTFLITASESGDALVKTSTTLPPHATGVARHYHLTYTETFTVEEGSLDMLVGQEKKHLVLTSGQSAHVPLRMPHRFWNSSDNPVTFVAVMQPARHFEKAMRIVFGLAQDGKLNKEGAPKNLWELALLLDISESYFAGLPALPQQVLFRVLAKIATWKGYDPLFPRYTQTGI